MKKKQNLNKGFGAISKEQLEKAKQAVKTKEDFPPSNKNISQEQNHQKTEKQRKALVVPDLNYAVPFMDKNGYNLTPSSGLIRLTQLAATAVQNSSACFALVWPTPIANLPMVHTLSTLAFYSTYNSRELRTVYWPAKTNTADFLKKIYIRTDWLHDHAVKVTNTTKQSRFSRNVKTQIRNKNWLFLKLDRYKKNTGLPLCECIHCYHRHREGHWKRKPGTAFESLIKTISKEERKHAKIRAKNAANTLQAGDTLFCLHPSLDSESLKQALTSPEFDPEEYGTPPNLAILDLRFSNWYHLENKWQKLKLLFERFQKLGPIGPAGILAITDSPAIFKMLQGSFDKSEVLQTIVTGVPLPRFTAVEALKMADLHKNEECHEKRYGLIQPGSFDLQLLARPTADVVNKLLDLALNISSYNREGALALRSAAWRLHKISMMPGGLKAFENWLGERLEEKKSNRSRSVWKTHIIELNNLLESGKIGEDYAFAENLIREADEHASSLETSTPAGKALEEILDLVTEEESWFCQKLVVSIDTKPGLFLCQDMIETLLGKNSVVEIVLTKEIPEIKFDENTALVSMISYHDNLRYLFMLQGKPNWVRIVLGHSISKQTNDMLSDILARREFANLHPLATRIKEQINKSAIDFSAIPTLNEEGPFQTDEILVNTEKSQSSSRNKITVYLSDDHPPVHFHPRSKVYILDSDSSWGYREEIANKLQEEDVILLLPSRMTEMIGNYVQRIKDESKKQAAKHVKAYQELVRCCLEKEKNSYNGSFPLIEVAKKINNEQKPKKPIKEANISYWLKAAEEDDIENAAPHAPKDKDQFRAFAAYLGFPENYIEQLYFYIKILRQAHRKEGRKRKEEVLSILSDHLAHMNREDIPEEIVKKLRKEASRHSYKVCKLVGLENEV